MGGHALGLPGISLTGTAGALPVCGWAGSGWSGAGLGAGFTGTGLAGARLTGTNVGGAFQRT